MEALSKIRIREGSSEIELEGSEKFVSQEAQKWLERVSTLKPRSSQAGEGGLGEINSRTNGNSGPSIHEIPPNHAPQDPDLMPIRELLWKRLLEPHLKFSGLWSLRYAPKARAGENHVAEAALMLLAAHRDLERRSFLTALELMRALKASGVNPSRLDIPLKTAVSKGLINPSGTRRARRYEITSQGLREAARNAAEAFPKALQAL